MNEQWYKNKQKVNAFLSFKYIPQKDFSVPKEIINAFRETEIKSKKSELLQKGKKALIQGFDSILSKYPNNITHVVPLSGGIDSRTILGYLINNVEKSSIITITFGTPGTLDFEIGQKLATELGLKNYAIDLTPNEFNWSKKFLIDSAKEYSRPTQLFRAHEAFKYFSDKLKENDHIYWSGFMGGPVAGSTLPEKKSESWEQALRFFINKNFSNADLISENFNPINVLPDQPDFSDDVLSYDEQLDYGIRQPYYIKPSAVPNDRFVTPYLTEPWLEFILNVPYRYRPNKRLFKDIISYTYPKLFSIETTNNRGLPLDTNPYYVKINNIYLTLLEKIKGKLGINKPRLGTNHFDWDIELRRCDSFIKFVRKQLKDLQERDMVNWLTPTNFLEQHLKGKNYAKEIRILTSLEIFVKSS